MSRELVRARAGGACEAEASRRCTSRGQHFHHRKLRRHGEETVANLLYVCAECHFWIHANVGASYELGLLVRSWKDPADVPLSTGAGILSGDGRKSGQAPMAGGASSGPRP